MTQTDTPIAPGVADARDALARFGHGLFTGGPWLLSEPRIRDLADKLRTVLASGATPAADREASLAEDGGYPGVPQYSKEGGVARIPMVGVLTKYPSWFDDFMGLCPTEAVRACLADAVADTTVKQVVLVIDTPGGVVNGTVELAYAVRAANKVKPVVAYVSGMCCSGGVYVASQAGKVYAAPGSEIGCIGVYCVLTDTSKAWADIGVSRVLVSTGRFKGLGADGKVSEDMVADQQRIVNDLGAQFVADVAAGRGVEPAVIQLCADGRTWLAPEAQQLNLIDGVAPDVGAAALLTGGTRGTYDEEHLMTDQTSTAAAGAAANGNGGTKKNADGTDDGDAPDPAGDARTAMGKAIDTANGHKTAARKAMDAAGGITGDPDDATVALAKQVVAACESAAEESTRCAQKMRGMAGMDQVDGDDDDSDAAAKPAAISDLLAAFPDAHKFVVEQFQAKATLAKATGAYAGVLTDQLRAARDENTRLKTELAGLSGGADPVGFAGDPQDPGDEPAAAGDSAAADAKGADPAIARAIAAAKQEWKVNKGGCRNAFASEAIYANVRKRELVGTA